MAEEQPPNPSPSIPNLPGDSTPSFASLPPVPASALPLHLSGSSSPMLYGSPYPEHAARAGSPRVGVMSMLQKLPFASGHHGHIHSPLNVSLSSSSGTPIHTPTPPNLIARTIQTPTPTPRFSDSPMAALILAQNPSDLRSRSPMPMRMVHPSAFGPGPIESSMVPQPHPAMLRPMPMPAHMGFGSATSSPYPHLMRSPSQSPAPDPGIAMGHAVGMPKHRSQALAFGMPSISTPSPRPASLPRFFPPPPTAEYAAEYAPTDRAPAVHPRLEELRYSSGPAGAAILNEDPSDVRSQKRSRNRTAFRRNLKFCGLYDPNQKLENGGGEGNDEDGNPRSAANVPSEILNERIMRRIRVWMNDEMKIFYDCVCGKRKPTQDLKKIAKHASGHDVSLYPCKHCGRIFTHHLGRNSHQRIHKEAQASASSSQDADGSFPSQVLASGMPLGADSILVHEEEEEDDEM